MSTKTLSFKSSKTATTTKKTTKKDSAQAEIESPKAGANAFHWYNYDRKVKLGDDYDYQEVLEAWRKMSDSRKKKFQEMAEAKPKHKKLPGRQRAASGYDILRRELSNNDYKQKGLNLNTMASEIRAWLINNHNDDWEQWTTTPTDRHLRLIKKAVREIDWAKV